jgi:hypothetical protein
VKSPDGLAIRGEIRSASDALLLAGEFRVKKGLLVDVIGGDVVSWPHHVEGKLLGATSSGVIVRGFPVTPHGKNCISIDALRMESLPLDRTTVIVGELRWRWQIGGPAGLVDYIKKSGTRVAGVFSCGIAKIESSEVLADHGHIAATVVENIVIDVCVRLGSRNRALRIDRRLSRFVGALLECATFYARGRVYWLRRTVEVIRSGVAIPVLEEWSNTCLGGREEGGAFAGPQLVECDRVGWDTVVRKYLRERELLAPALTAFQGAGRLTGHVEFLMLCTALEAMKEHYLAETGKSSILGRSAFNKKVAKRVRAVLREQCAPGDASLMSEKVAELNRPSLVRVLEELCQARGCDAESLTGRPDPFRFIQVRNGLVHAGAIPPRAELLECLGEVRVLLEAVVHRTLCEIRS